MSEPSRLKSNPVKPIKVLLADWKFVVKPDLCKFFVQNLLCGFNLIWFVLWISYFKILLQILCFDFNLIWLKMFLLFAFQSESTSPTTSRPEARPTPSRACPTRWRPWERNKLQISMFFVRKTSTFITFLFVKNSYFCLNQLFRFITVREVNFYFSNILLKPNFFNIQEQWKIK